MPTMPAKPAAGDAPWTGVGNAIYDSVQGPLFAGYQSSAQSIPFNTYTAVTLDAENVDTHNGHPTAAGSNTKWTCPTGWGGYYLCSGVIMFATDSTGVRVGFLRKTGTGTTATGAVLGSLSRVQPASDGFGNTVPISPVVVPFADGDYIELITLHTNTGSTALNLFTTSPYTSGMNVTFLRFT